ncbi:methyl-accepting chemotaxis sensory transducer [Candidatus Gastranaerophilus sp. (ex Termes propinquus)]|nr:methyl-accepting chemotaxis sensory transducer [Candidatus Gastranaerophilus sp. (ex Termes propinquus)]
MYKLEISSSEVSKIIKVIDDIAFQTNILSLNAAVEAAGAGDAGKGFAVVAEEVRNLAQRSAEAARETSVLIDGNVNLTKSAVRVSAEVGSALKKINSSVSKVKGLLDEISTASQEQVIAVGQIAQAVTQIDHVVQAQSGIAATTSQGANSVRSHCDDLKRITNDLISIVKKADKSLENTRQKQIGTAKAGEKHGQKAIAQQNHVPTASVEKKQLPGARSVSPNDIIPLDDF